MFNTSQARDYRDNKELLWLEEKIKKAIINNSSYVVISLGSSDARKLEEKIEPLGYSMECSGCSGWSTMYYRIAW